MPFKIRNQISSNKTIRMPDELIAKLEILASLNDVSFNQVVVQACQYALDEIESSEEESASKPDNV